MKEKSQQKSIWVLFPLFGVLVFVTLYIVATLLYPGGSQADKNSIGFSWVNNYWCNLLSAKAINGQYNPAQPVAITGMLVLWFALLIFWFLFTRHMKVKRSLKIIIQISGTLSMVTGLFLLTNIDHDLIINLSSSFGVITSLAIMISLYENKLYLLFAFGIFILLLVILNNYYYHTEGLIIYLPVVQKVTFSSFLIWISCLDINLYRSCYMNSYAGQ